VKSGWMLVPAAALGITSQGADAADTPVAAAWQKHALIVDLHHLPKRYSCDELWYKFKDVLLAVGAAPEPKIVPYRCDRRVGALGYSPKVQLKFSTPVALTGANNRWATIRAVSRSVRLQPGELAHIDEEDCALLSQLRATLLKALNDPVTTFHLACLAPSTAKPPFGLTVRALVPIRETAPEVASSALRGRAARSGS